VRASPQPIRIGQEFTDLTVDALVRDESGHPLWRCNCRCGGVVNVAAKDLNARHRTSCGCRRISEYESRVHARVVPPADQRSALGPDAQRAIATALDDELLQRMGAR
jgi:hypothetical protein